MLEMNPNKRITALEIIRHPYFANLQGFNPKEHLPDEVYQVYINCSHQQSMTKTAHFPLNDIKNIMSPLNKLNKMRPSNESETSILDSLKRV